MMPLIRSQDVKQLFLLLFFFSLFAPAFADIQLPYVFGSNMVLQQQTNAAIWGQAKAGSTVLVESSWSHARVRTKADGAGKWKVFLPTPAAGGPFTITIRDGGHPLTLTNVLVGEVWLCSGQSNMEMPMKGFKSQPVAGSNDAIVHSRNPQIRWVTIPRWATTVARHNSKPTTWKEASPENVADFSATAYYFARLLQEATGVPVGLVHTSYGGSNAEAWMDEPALKAFPEIRVPATADSAKVNNRSATALFNGMLQPVIGFTIKGAIWYQGESNYDRPEQYLKLFPAMVQRWRTLWGQGDFPFYYAQIAPYNYAQLPPYNSGGRYNSAFLREAQLKARQAIPNSGMVVLLDIGEEACIHPMHKREGGERLAYWALAQNYGLKGFGYRSPELDSMTVKGSLATLYFGNAGNGLTTFGKPLELFEIAGADKRFYPAQALIAGGRVMVAAPEVGAPVAVRYAFRDYVKGTLFSTEGLPVSSFRTDSWDAATPVYLP